MDDRIVSTAVLTLSRQQEEFLARYRTHEAQKAYFESYGLGVTPFFRGGGGSHGVIPPSPEPVLPYDYEVEYLEVNQNSGLAYIDTNYVLNGLDLYIHCLFTFIGYSNNPYCRWFGSWSDDSRNKYRIIRSVSDSSLARLNYAGSGNAVFSVSPYTHYDIIMNKGGESVVNGNVVLSSAPNSSTNDSPMYIFSPVENRITYGRIHFFVMSDNGNPIVDMIPVSKNGIGYMYDKVSGELFAAQGGGSFVVGPRKI